MYIRAPWQFPGLQQPPVAHEVCYLRWDTVALRNLRGSIVSIDGRNPASGRRGRIAETRDMLAGFVAIRSGYCFVMW